MVVAAALALAACDGFPRKAGPATADAVRDRVFAARAAAIVARMSDEEVAGQLLLTGVEGSRRLSAASAALLERAAVGGVMLFKYNLGQGSEATRRFTDECVAAAVAGERVRDSGAAGGAAESYRILPFVAVDHEGGSVHRFASDATRLPAAATFGAFAEKNGERAAADAVRETAYRAGLELRALGVTLNLAPVAEASDERSAAFLGDRSYGSDGRLVAAAAGAFVEGMDEAGVACVVKHFPGNAEGDPHRAAPVIALDTEGLGRMVAPFRTVISAARPAAVMVSHAVVEAVDPERPGSLSPAVVSGWLKGDLGFRGFVVTDDLRMGAVALTGRSPSRAAVEAVAAGADLIMTWPKDLLAVRDALVSAVADGRLPAERFRDAARRVIAAKFRYGLCMRIADAEGPGRERGEQDTEAVAETVARFRAETERYVRERGLE